MTELEEVLSHYGVEGKEIGIEQGPLIRQIIFEPKAGTKIKNITAHLEDIAREMKLKALRVEPVENSNCLGFEIPADEFQTVDFKTILASEEFKSAKGALPICLGVDITGKPQFADLAKMPHLLIAGTTGSGKSVGLNTFVLSLIARKAPKDLKLVMIDPKRIEFAVYNNQKYMLWPVITDNSKAALVLANLVEEMERRYSYFEESLTKNIAEYNEKADKTLPYVVCVIDEFADLMAATKEVSPLVQRLAQKARAAGIHLMMATQRPSVDVVTGVLKANFPTRLAYKVASGADSRTILDMPGAEDLIGRGDALFLAGDGTLKRIHGAYLPDEGIAAMLEPYRAEVKSMPEPKEVVSKEDKAATKSEKPKRNGIFSWWCSLRKREQKTIVSWFVALFKWTIKTVLETSGKRR
ncbi:MAG: hypothetical protein MJ210_03880 [Alphaproteobacteria bacterium]|nr:hypothetical protein [Alphaproteobacteria bacterium]